MGKKEVERKIFKVYENQVTELKNSWDRLLPHYKTLIEQLNEIGIEITKETLQDVIEFKGRKTVEILAEKAFADASKLGIKDPAVLQTLTGNPAARLEPTIKTVEMIQHVIGTSFTPIHLRTCYSYNYLTIEGEKISLSETTFQQIVDEFFTVFAESEQQKEILELCESSLPAMNKLIRKFWELKPWVTFNEIFEINEQTNEFELRASSLELFK